jgi:hypothetical protein
MEGNSLTISNEISRTFVDNKIIKLIETKLK